jgi:SAM-dependent MidA family methyltransferase
MSLASADLPQASPDALAASKALHDIIAAEITARGGWISFARYMELALYAPGRGYYSGGSRKFGSEGDFLTAPELTPLYGQALARQVAQVLAASAPQVIEAGAGSGRLAADLLLALDALGCAPEHYRILELSGELRARQQATLHERAPRLADRIEWLDELPERFSGCLVGNEVLDAMPTHALRWDDGSDVQEGGVGLEDGRLVPAERPATGALLAAAQAMPVARPHRGELGLAARAWVAELARRLECGAMLLIDYGLPRHELYHPQRDGGTVRCHYRHRVHDDPLWLPGTVRHHLARRFHRRGRGRFRCGAGRAGLHQPGRVPAQLRHRRGPRTGRRCRRTARPRRRECADLAQRDGRTVQGDRAGSRPVGAAARLRARRPRTYTMIQAPTKEQSTCKKN